jgi:hypothetical protein
MSLLLIVSAVSVGSFIAVVAMLELARRRPLTATDLACAALDEGLAERAAKDRPARGRDAVPSRRPRRAGRSPAAGPGRPASPPERAGSSITRPACRGVVKAPARSVDRLVT